MDSLPLSIHLKILKSKGEVEVRGKWSWRVFFGEYFWKLIIYVVNQPDTLDLR